jgi:hypothetical protein
MLAWLFKVKYISKIDIHNTSNLIRVWDEDVWKTAICTCYGIFQSLVISFRLTNAAKTFQQYVNKTICLYLDVFCTAYLDDFLIYCQTLKEHFQLVCQIIGLLQQAGLQVKPQKYEFHKTITEYQEILVTPESQQIDPSTVRTIKQ